MTAPARVLLAELAERGIEFRLDGDRIIYHPASALGPDHADRVRAVRSDVVRELEARQDLPTAAVLDLVDGEIVPEMEWTEVAPFTEPDRDLASCPGCRGRSWWRLRSGGPPVCARCHPPFHDEAQIERWEVPS